MQLIQLIESLTKTEKRHFRLYAQMGSKTKPKYLKLFDLLEKQQIYEEQVWKKKGYTVSDRAFLMDKILDSLQLSYARKDDISELHWLLGQFPHLWQKKLMDELRKRLRKAKQLGKRQEDFKALLQIVHWEKRMVNEKGSKNAITDYEKLEEEEKHIQVQLSNKLAYENLRVKLNLLRIKDLRLQKEANQRQFETLITTPLLGDKVSLLSIHAQANYFQIQCIIHRYQAQSQTAYDYVRQLVELFEVNPIFKKQHLAWYKKTLCLHIEISFSMGKQQDLPSLIDQIRNLCPITDRGIAEKELLVVTYLYGILHALGTVNQERGTLLIQELEQQWEDLEPLIQEHRQLAYFYNIMLFYVIFGDWDQAHTWLVRILHFKRIDERKDIQNTARIWQILIGYEMDAFNLDNHIQTAYKYLNRHEHYFEFEACMIKTFRQLIKTSDEVVEKKILEDSMNQLLQLLDQQEFGRQQLSLQEILLWVKAKIGDTNIAKVLNPQIAS